MSDSDSIADAMFWIEQRGDARFCGAEWSAEQLGGVSMLKKNGETVMTITSNEVFDELWHIAVEAALWCAHPQGKMMSLDYEGKR